jgi:hypothetical protein
MKLSPLLLLSLTLSAGLTQAAAQGGSKPAPPQIKRGLFTSPPRLPNDVPLSPDAVAAEPETTELLSSNYRIVIRATANGSQVGEISAQTCSAAFQINGFLSLPMAEDPLGKDLSVRGELSELEGGALKLSYIMDMTNPVPSQSFGMMVQKQAVPSVYGHQLTNGALGTLMMKPGQSYDVMQISGVVYALTITPTETPPAPANAKKQADAEPGEKPEPGDKPSAGAPAATQPPAEGFRPENRKPADAERRGPSEEDRKRYESLSDEAKEKFREFMKERFSDAAFRNSPVEERRAEIRRLFDKAAAEDQAKKK